MINALQDSQLAWFPEQGIGFYPVKEQPYDFSYFEKYKELSKTPIGKALNKARIDLVNKYTDGEVLDIGIGSGDFVKNRPNTKGYDINPHAVKWLTENKLFKNPIKPTNSLTFWDSLEHIHEPKKLLESAKEYVFVSCPIYKDLKHLLGSKHYKPSEHCWYWTLDGVKTFMKSYGFELLEYNWQETDIGREDIGSFVFKRIQ
jgi:hypothetical protein